MIGTETVLMEKVLGPEVGGFLRRLHEEHGVTFHFGTTAASIDSQAVVLKNGDRLQADLVPHSTLGWLTPDEYANTFNPRRALALRSMPGSAPAPVAHPGHIGQTNRQSLIQAG